MRRSFLGASALAMAMLVAAQHDAQAARRAAGHPNSPTCGHPKLLHLI